MSSNTQHRIMLAGGGTAGHVNPLLAVADAIRCQMCIRDSDKVRSLSLAIAMVMAAGVKKANIRSALRVSRELH